MFSKTSPLFRRTLTRVAVAGALVAVPLGALAVTASADTPESPDTVVLQQPGEVQEGTEIGRHPRHHQFPGPGEHRRPDGPRFFQLRPPTGSAGSS
ncbi:hypothetical protein [Nocardia sp. NPDC052566]|uniref:hypothetical protein n=1 Tax=Nocardia sp. NPDC052566 TaxID=3364330 RepID=UPI0037C7EA0B